MANEEIKQSDIEEIKKLNRYYNDVAKEISANTSGTNYRRNSVLDELVDDIDDVLYGEVKKVTDFTGSEISKFLTKLYNEMDAPTQQNIQTAKIDSMEDLFKAENGSIMNFFQERYKNKNFLYDDLNLICSQLYELKEAVLTTRDSIVTADDMTESISRTIKLEGGSDDELLPIIETIERQLKLPTKIKNHIIPKTLQYGTYYAYTIPYSRILEKYQQKQVKKVKNSLQTVTESTELINEYTESIKSSSQTSYTKEQISKGLLSMTENISVVNEDLTIPVVESYDSEELKAFISDDAFRNLLSNIDKNIKAEESAKNKRRPFDKTNFTTDAVVDTNRVRDGKVEDFNTVKGCYVKLISPKDIIPIKIMDNITIGYYYIIENAVQPLVNRNTTGITSANSPSFTNVGNTPENKQDLEKQMVSKIADMVVKSFDKKFLEKNEKFKELITNCLMFDDLYKKNIQFQFIEKEYITEFTVNEDENGEGVSILADSLFYSKLYLALLLFKMITIITKSNDTKLYYIKNSSVDKDISNKVQEIARSIKQKQLNIKDLMNYNSMVTKLGANKDIFMPVGRSGERAIDFDILAGQDVQLDTELMEKLRTNAISSTGVPSVMMSYVNEADYSRTLVMANAKFMSRVASYQTDFNGPLTDLYRKILKYCTDWDNDKIERLVYKLHTPKTLNNTNLNDQINNAETILSFMVENRLGREADMSDDDRILKDKLFNDMMREYLPQLPWKLLDEKYETNKILLEKYKREKKAFETEDESEE